MTLGCDYGWERPDPTALFQAGYRFACRYLSLDTTGKNLTATEAQALRRAGLSIVLNWEFMPQAALRGFIQGHDDAVQAAAQRAQVGAPNSVPVYFSIDFNATAAQLPEVLSYLAGCASVLGRDGTGVYGSASVINAAAGAGVCKWMWQTYAWSGGLWDGRAHIRQTLNGVPFNGVSIDRDESMAVDYGQWDSGGVEGMAFLLSIDDPTLGHFDGLADGVGGYHYLPDAQAYNEAVALVGMATHRTVSSDLAKRAYGVDIANHPSLADVLAAVKADSAAPAGTVHVTGDLTVGP